jgi:hypothetical protein
MRTMRYLFSISMVEIKKKKEKKRKKSKHFT